MSILFPQHHQYDEFSCFADQRDAVQKKTFTKWVNKHLIKVGAHIVKTMKNCIRHQILFVALSHRIFYKIGRVFCLIFHGRIFSLSRFVLYRTQIVDFIF